MASIIKVGEGWRALIRRKGHPSYCKTFKTKAQADVWARQVEGDIDRGKAPSAASVMGRSLLLRDVISAYRDLRDRSRPIPDTSNEHYMLKHLTEGLGALDATVMTPQDLVGYCQMRRDEGAGPYTCNMEISKLGTAMRYAGVGLKVVLPDVAAAARPLLKHLALIGGGGKRERRPTEDELVQIIVHLAEVRGQLFADVVRFAVATAMRRGEISRLQWEDVDRKRKLVLVRDRKDPRKKEGNDQWVPLLGDAWTILNGQPQVDGETRIFPIGESTVSKYFTEACRTLCIPDLHFHDLRHEGTSRLFEEGFEIQQVALVTGHKDWRHLRRYTNLRPEDLHTTVIDSTRSRKQLTGSGVA